MGDADGGWSPTAKVLLWLGAATLVVVMVFLVIGALDYSRWVAVAVNLGGATLGLLAWLRERAARRNLP